jgi:hypothetical protein
VSLYEKGLEKSLIYIIPATACSTVASAFAPKETLMDALTIVRRISNPSLNYNN